MPKINEAFPSKYLKAADLEDRQHLMVMERAEFEMLGDERKLILYFQNQKKGLVLNKTNANTIAAKYGDDTEDWLGKEIVLFEAMVDFQGKTGPAIRVRAPKAKAAPVKQEMSDEIPF
jgi:arabinogalactan endo-1,4-beta-galactosidase